MTKIDDVPLEWKNYLKNTLKVPETKWDQSKANKYWAQLKNIDSRPRGWLMFPAKPELAPKTFPFFNNKNEDKAIPYYFDLLRSLSKESNYTGRTITGWLAHNKKPLNFYTKLEDDFEKINLNEDDDAPPFLGTAAISFKTDKASFIKANNDANELIQSIATYDTNSMEGQELRSYHNALLSQAQEVLNRIQAKQSHAVNLRKEIIDMEWRRFVDQNEYTYGQWDRENRYVRSNTLTMDRTKLRQLMNPSYTWVNDDYAIFDRNLFDEITNGYKAWRKWAEKERLKYRELCNTFFIEPKNFKLVKEGAVPLKMTKRGLQRTDYKLRKRMKLMTPVKEEEMDVEEEIDEEDDSDVEEIVVNPKQPVEVISNDTDNESEMDDNTSAGEEEEKDPPASSSEDYTTETDPEEEVTPKKNLEDLTQAELVEKRNELEEKNNKTTEESNELAEINKILKEKFETPCKNKINNRIARIRASLKGGKWHIDENKNEIVYGDKKTDISEDGIKKLLITKDEKVGNELCTRDLREFFAKKVGELLKFIKEEGGRINKKLDIEQLEKRKKKLLKDFKKSNKVKKENGDLRFELGNVFVSVSKIEDILRNDKYGTTQNAIPLNGGYSKKEEQDERIKEYAKAVQKVIEEESYKEEEVIKVTGDMKIGTSGMTSAEVKKGDKTYIMRILDVQNKFQADHYDWLTSFDKNKTTKTHLLPLYIYQSWDVQAKVATFTQTDKMDGFKLQFDENFVEPRISGKQRHVIYFQEKCTGTDLRTWIERKFYVIKQTDKGKAILDEKNRKTIDKFYGTLLNDDNDTKSQEEVLKIVKNVYDAVKEFHKITPNFAHRDVKLENFCIDDKNQVYLIDFDNVLDTRGSLNSTATIPMKNGKVYEGDKKIHDPEGILPTASFYDDSKYKGDDKGAILMDRYNTKSRMTRLLKKNALAADLHQAGMAMLQLGGVFDWTSEYNWPEEEAAQKEEKQLARYNNMRATFGLLGDNKAYNDAVNELHIIDFWRSLWLGFRKGVTGTGSTFNQLPAKDQLAAKVKNATAFIQTLRTTDQNSYRVFNLQNKVVNYIANNFFKTDAELLRGDENMNNGMNDPPLQKAANVPTNLQSPVITSPTKFMSTQRQPVFEKVSLESDFDDEDLQALMDFDPNVAELSDTSSPRSHISDAEFERMLHEDDNYDMLTEHIVKENKAYSKKEIEEDARSIGSSNHSSASALSVASQISNASNASNASNISNLSASSEKSNVSDMSNHSYMSNNSLESEEHYPTSEQSYHMSEVSYNQSSDNSYNSGTESSSGKDMDYSQGISESSDHDSSNESLGYSSSGNSSQNHSYNSSSDTE